MPRPGGSRRWGGGGFPRAAAGSVAHLRAAQGKNQFESPQYPSVHARMQQALCVRRRFAPEEMRGRGGRSEETPENDIPQYKEPGQRENAASGSLPSFPLGNGPLYPVEAPGQYAIFT